MKGKRRIFIFLRFNVPESLDLIDDIDKVTHLLDEEGVVVLVNSNKESDDENELVYNQILTVLNKNHQSLRTFQVKFDFLRNFKVFEEKSANNEINKNSPIIIILKNFEEGINFFNEDLTNLNEFLKLNAYPSLQSLKSDTYVYANSQKQSFAIFLCEKNDENKELIEKFYNLALKHKKDLYFLIGEFNDQYDTTLSYDFKFKEQDLPIVLINKYDKQGQKRYKTEEIKDIENFFEEYFKGTLKPLKMSQKLSDSIYHNGVLRLVALNFEEKVFENEKKNSFVYFFNKRCDLCKEARMNFEKIALIYQNQEILEFFSINVERNEIDYNVSGFPSLILFKEGKNKKENYVIFEENDFSFENIERFINKEL